MANNKIHKHKIINIAKNIAIQRQNPLLILKINEVRKIHALKVHDLLCKENFTNLDVVLQTPGGDIDTAYMITKFLRNQSKKVQIIVPLFAKSAGTLICLGADELILTAVSELGPLDTQIPEEKDGNQRYKSALNGFKALEQVQRHVLETLDITTKLLLSRSRMKITEAIKLATKFSGETSSLLYQKLNPEKIGEYARALEIGEKYGINILTRYMGWSKQQAESTIRKLVKDYPSHEFVVDVEELQELSLPAKYVGKEDIDIFLEMRQALLYEKNDVIDLIKPINNNNKNNEK